MKWNKTIEGQEWWILGATLIIIVLLLISTISPKNVWYVECISIDNTPYIIQMNDRPVIIGNTIHSGSNIFIIPEEGMKCTVMP
jgi:hypothetical protein